MTRILAAVLGCLIFVAPAMAEGACFPWEDALVTAYTEFGQLPAAIAVADGGVLIFTVNPETKDWAMFVQPNADTICLLAAGEHWGPPSQRVLDNILRKAQPGEDV